MRNTFFSWAAVISSCTCLKFMPSGFSISTFFCAFMKSSPVLKCWGWIVPMYTTSTKIKGLTFFHCISVEKHLLFQILILHWNFIWNFNFRVLLSLESGQKLHQFHFSPGTSCPERWAHQCLDLVPAPHNSHMYEGFCVVSQTLRHAAGPSMPRPQSEHNQNWLYYFTHFQHTGVNVSWQVSVWNYQAIILQRAWNAIRNLHHQRFVFFRVHLTM